MTFRKGQNAATSELPLSIDCRSSGYPIALDNGPLFSSSGSISWDYPSPGRKFMESMDVPRFQPVRSVDQGDIKSRLARSRVGRMNDYHSERGDPTTQHGIHNWFTEDGTSYPIMPKQAYSRFHNASTLGSTSSSGSRGNGSSMMSHSNASQVSLPTSCGSSDITESSISLSDVGQYSYQPTYPDLVPSGRYSTYGTTVSESSMSEASPTYNATRWGNESAQDIPNSQSYPVSRMEDARIKDIPDRTRGLRTNNPILWPVGSSRSDNSEQLQRSSSHLAHSEQYPTTTMPFVSSMSASDSLVSFRTHPGLLPRSSLSRRSSVTQPDDVSIGTSALASQECFPFSEYSLDEGLAPLTTFHPMDIPFSGAASHSHQVQPYITASQHESFPISPTQENRSRRLSDEIDIGPPRDHPLYQAVPRDDGLYHCPYENEEGCAHKPEKLKCNYDKHVDSHLKPYRCKLVTCTELRFSSTACLLRHEREAHGMHGHGAKPHLCTYEDCERSMPGNGFPRRWNLFDHMRRVHDFTGPPSSTGSNSPPLSPDYAQVSSPKSQQARKRKAFDVNPPQVTKRNRSVSSATGESNWTMVSSRTSKERAQQAKDLESEWNRRRAMLKDRLNKVQDPHDSRGHERLQAEIVALQGIAVDVRRLRVAPLESKKQSQDMS